MAEKSSAVEPYQQDIRSTFKALQTDRGVKEYVEILGFKNEREFLDFLPRDGLVLDLGSGMGKLSKDLRRTRPDLTVVSLNPALSEEKFARKQKRFELGSGNWVKDIFERKEIDAGKRTSSSTSAMNPRLPFKDASFDVVLDSMSSVYYARRPSVMSDEIIRVLKFGSNAMVGPLLFDRDIQELTTHLNAVESITFETRGAKTLGVEFGTAFLIHKK